MGTTTYPCPACFQAQSVEHQNGQDIASALCPACAEEARKLTLSEEAYIAYKRTAR